MKQILYTYKFNISIFHFIFLISTFIVIRFFVVNNNAEKISAAIKRINSKIGLIMTIHIAFFYLLLCFAVAQSLIGNVIAYKSYLSGKYNVVEGEVKNFKDGSKDGRYNESFYLGDVFFEYSNSSEEIGYNKIRLEDGVITGNGQKLKIGYIYNYYGDKGNRIVYIETHT